MAEGVGESKYEVGSTVYVPYEGGTHYQARVIKKEVREHVIHGGTKAPMWFYLVHYMGWNKKYDEWVEEVGCASENPETLIIPNKTKPKGGAAHAGAGKYDYAKPQISIAIPGLLKQQLIEDHDTVKEDKNIPMPRSPCILNILDSYKEHARQSSSATPDIDEQVAEQVAHGIRNYFDRTLALLLLYNEERAQADGLLKNGDSPSSIYGAEHLLRLFLKLPDLLPIESSTEEQYRMLQDKLHDLLDFLKIHRADYFLPTSSYITAMGPSTHTAAAPQPSAAPQAGTAAAPPAAVPAADVAGAIAPAPGAVKLAAAPPPLSAAALAQQPQPMQH